MTAIKKEIIISAIPKRKSNKSIPQKSLGSPGRRFEKPSHGRIIYAKRRTAKIEKEFLT